MDNQALKFVELIANFPPNSNPYLATAQILETRVHSPPSPPWSRHLRIALLIFTEVMLGQSLFLLYQRIRISKPPMIKFNNLGLLIVNISYIAGMSYMSYSIMTIYTLIVQIGLDLGHKIDESKMLLVFGVKFFPPILSAWAFVWVCACQSARILWNSDLATRIGRDVLKNFISRGLSSLFIFLAFGPLAPIAWHYIKAYKSLKEIESIASYVASTLEVEAKSYDPHNFSPLRILPLLIPAKKILTLQDDLENSLRHGQKLYLSVLCVLSLIYIPFITISLTGLYKQSVSQAVIDAATGLRTRSKRSHISKKIHHQRQRLVWHAICAYCATLTHLPVLAYEHILSQSPGFTQNTKWHQFTFQGLTIPLAFTGNVVLAILNLHAYLILQDRARNMMKQTDLPSTNCADKNLFQKAINFARGFISVSDDNFNQLEDLDRNPEGQSSRSDKGAAVSMKDEGIQLPTRGIAIAPMASFSSSQ